jgi:hypothetical protein
LLQLAFLPGIHCVPDMRERIHGAWSVGGWLGLLEHVRAGLRLAGTGALAEDVGLVGVMNWRRRRRRGISRLVVGCVLSGAVEDVGSNLLSGCDRCKFWIKVRAWLMGH